MINDIIGRIRTSLTQTFTEVFECFDTDKNLLNYTPAKGGWTINQILIHISLTNHFLLILIRKGTTKAMEKSAKADMKTLLADYHFDWQKIEVVGKHRSFEWNRPAHMEPVNSVDLADVKIKLQAQLDECLVLLDKLKNGEGILHNTMMSVNNIGKIDVYHYIYFLGQHARRHISQMEKIKNEFTLVN
ncbi:MAG: DinB family protein [Chitinophagaceae bacterium]